MLSVINPKMVSVRDMGKEVILRMPGILFCLRNQFSEPPLSQERKYTLSPSVASR
jgi:hypothetical protein